MIAIALPAFFIAAGLFAAFALFTTWQTYAAEFRAIRAGLRSLDDTRDFAVRLALTQTHEFLPLPRRNAVKPRAALLRQQRHAPRAAA